MRAYEKEHGESAGVNFAWAQFPEVDPEIPHIPEGQEKLSAIVGIDTEELPMLVGVTPTGDRLDLTSEVDSLKPEQLAQYALDLKESNFRKYMKSEEPVNNTESDLITLVGSNFNFIAKDS